MTVSRAWSISSGRSAKALLDESRRFQNAAGSAGDAVEVVTGTEHAHQQLPAGRVLAGFALAHREVWAQQLAAVLQRRLQLRGHRAVVRARVAPWRELPPEHHRRERPGVR